MTDPALFERHFQNGYVVRDVRKATAAMGERFGITEWRIVEIPPGMEIAYLAFAYAGDVLFELIELNPEVDSFFRAWQPDDDRAAKLNHLAYKMRSLEEFEATAARFAGAGYGIAVEGDLGGVRFVYYDTVADLGYFCELNYLAPEAANFYDAPRN